MFKKHWHWSWWYEHWNCMFPLLVWVLKNWYAFLGIIRCIFSFACIGLCTCVSFIVLLTKLINVTVLFKYEFNITYLLLKDVMYETAVLLLGFCQTCIMPPTINPLAPIEICCRDVVSKKLWILGFYNWNGSIGGGIELRNVNTHMICLKSALLWVWIL